jgi:hypothetical protein
MIALRWPAKRMAADSFTYKTRFAFGHGSDRTSYVGRKCSHVTAIGNVGIELR